MIEIDGSMHEGGGQMLRTAAALSCIFGRPFKISSIRAKRDRPGLQRQHLAGMAALAEMCSAKTSGMELGSTSLSFSPGKISGGARSFDIGTAGSVTLVLQTLLPALLFAPSPSTIQITGGTHVPFSPTAHYAKHILVPTLARMGAKCGVEIRRLGWFPKGGGKILVEIQPASALSPTNLTSQGDLKRIFGFSCASSLPAHVAERQAESARNIFTSADISAETTEADCAGSALTLIAEYSNCLLGASALGERGKKAEDVGKEAARALLTEINSTACADIHLTDQLLVFAALAKGESKIKTSQITSHTRTNIWLIRQFCGAEFELDEQENMITIKGIGLERG